MGTFKTINERKIKIQTARIIHFRNKTKSLVKIIDKPQDAPGACVRHNLNFEQPDVLLQLVHHRSQIRVFRLEVFHLILQLGDAFQLARSTFGSGETIALSFPLEFHAFLVFHVDGRDRRGRVQIGDRLGFLFYDGEKAQAALFEVGVHFAANVWK